MINVLAVDFLGVMMGMASAICRQIKHHLQIIFKPSVQSPKIGFAIAIVKITTESTIVLEDHTKIVKKETVSPQ